MGRVVGIDLGTTNSVVGFVEGGEARIIPTSEGPPLCPSVVAFSKTGERLVGQLAKRQSITNPDRTIMSIKRQMGTDYSVTIDGKTYTPQEISAFVLMKLKRDAEAYLGEELAGAVITCPAYFSDSQRQATKDAGTIAGLNVLRIINEPTAAALAYGADREEVGTILVWDLGGGTFDVSILEVSEGIFEVRATNGDTHLGGDDWDARIVDFLADTFQSANGIDLRKDKMALQRLREAAERAKTELSTMVQTNVNLPFISSTPEGPLHLDTILTRAKMEELTDDLLGRMKGPTESALEDAKLKPETIDRVLLVGGATRMPAVQRLITEMLGKEPTKGTNPDEVVAAGAAIQASVLSGESREIVLLDVTPLSLGIETLGGIFTRLIERNTTIPASNTMTFTTAEDGQQVVDIKVYQGEREMAVDNKKLGAFLLSGIPPAPRGVPKIDVTFDIDVNGIVHVSARDQATDAERKVVITVSGGLSREQVEQMKREAAEFATEDKQKREAAEMRNKAETLVWSAEKTVKEQGAKASPDVVASVTQAVEELKSALAANDDERIAVRHEILINLMYKLTSSLYEKSSAYDASSEPAPKGDSQDFGDSVFADEPDVDAVGAREGNG